jgi:myo-inositol-1(or 4)-monophosphatase
MDDDLTLLIAAMRGAGALALKHQAAGFKQSHKSDGSLVTEVDLAVDGFLRNMLCGPRPDYGWLSEESPENAERLAARKTWIVDPIDGTRSFSRHGANWCIGVALVEAGRPVLSCVYHPQLQRLYHAVVGRGAYLNDVPLEMDGDGAITNARVMGSAKQTKLLERSGMEITPSGDAPLLARFAMVAGGELEATVATGPKYDWDLAAGELLVTEAGGKVSAPDGSVLCYNQLSRQQSGLVAANAARHKAIITILETP